mmetsp:Transcript_23083/g.65423  ORF Transcript_23083/g.65423 Transcript_23083/m.65423 type:complete len:389 (-) Transcript_23083:276-1442(-)
MAASTMARAATATTAATTTTARSSNPKTRRGDLAASRTASSNGGCTSATHRRTQRRAWERRSPSSRSRTTPRSRSNPTIPHRRRKRHLRRRQPIAESRRYSIMTRRHPHPRRRYQRSAARLSSSAITTYTANAMVPASCIGAMAMSIEAISSMGCGTAMACCRLRMAPNTSANGTATTCKAKVGDDSQTAMSTSEPTFAGSDMDSASYTFRTAISTSGNGSKTRSTTCPARPSTIITIPLPRFRQAATAVAATKRMPRLHPHPIRPDLLHPTKRARLRRLQQRQTPTPPTNRHKHRHHRHVRSHPRTATAKRTNHSISHPSRPSRHAPFKAATRTANATARPNYNTPAAIWNALGTRKVNWSDPSYDGPQIGARHGCVIHLTAESKRN